MRMQRTMGLRALVVGILLGALVFPATTVRAASPSSIPRVTSTIVRVENTASALSPRTPAVTAVRLGQSVRVAMYGYFTNLNPGTTVGVGLTISGAGGVSYASRGTVNLTKITGTVSGWRWFWNTVHPCTSSRSPYVPPECIPQAPGRYTLSAFIGLAGTQYAKSTSFVVVER